MAVYSGHKGAVKVGANVVAEIEEFSIEVSREIHSYITLRQEFMGKAYGVGDWKGSASGRWYMGDTNGQAALQDALLDGTTATASFEIDSPAVGTYSGTILISNMKVENSGDGVAQVSFDFEGSGTPAFA